MHPITALMIHPAFWGTRNAGRSFARLATALVLATTATIIGAEPLPAGAVAADSPLVKGAELTITVADYRQALLGVPPQARSQIEHDPTTLREFLMQLYGEQRLAQEAQRQGLSDTPEVQATLAAARRQVLMNAVLSQFKASLQQPDFTELAREYYLTHRQEFMQPEQIRVAHILLRVPDACEGADDQKRKKAEAVRAELRQGADFTALALQYSEDQVTAKQGGQMQPWLKRGMLVPPFEEAAFALPEPGAVSEVIKTIYGYHIIKLLARQPGTAQPFEQVQGQIVKKLAEQYRLSAQKDYEAQFLPTPEQFDQTVLGALVQAAPAPSGPPLPRPAAKKAAP